jgi:hypothetical protein
MGIQRNSGFIFNITENNSSYYNSNRQNKNELKDSLNDNNNYIKLGGTSTLNKATNYFKKINNLYENNYTHKHINTNSKSDLSKGGKIPTDKNYRNTISNKTDNVTNRRQMQRSFNNNNYNNNSLNYNNNRPILNKSCKKDRVNERSHNKDYKYKKMISPNTDSINNNMSLNDFAINKPYNINNKSIDLQIFDYVKKNSDDKENINKKISNQSLSKMNNNKSMDSKRLLNNNINSNIIHINNGKIINLSNLSNFSYATEKYDCYYENKRATPNINANNNKKYNTYKNKNIKTNINNYTNKKKPLIEENINKNLNKTSNINSILFTKKYPKKDINKYPLRINYTDENLGSALENESLLEFIDKENGNGFSSKKDSRIIKKNHKIKNNYEINKNILKNDNSNINRNKHYYISEKVSSNDNNRNKSLTKANRNIIQKNYNLFFSGDNNMYDNIKNGQKKIKKKESNNISKKNSFTTIHDSLSFNPKKTYKNNTHILEIKNNERLMIPKNGNHNKVNSMNENNFMEQKIDRTYKISSHVVDEQFYKDNFSEKEINSSDDENVLRMSIQSLNDSKIMEIANRYITDEENLDKNEIIEILNSKKDKN